MKTTKLRAILRDGGAAGVLLVGLFLLAHHLWTRRRLPSVLVCGLLLGGVLVCCLQRRPAKQILPTPLRATVPFVIASPKDDSTAEEPSNPQNAPDELPVSPHRPSPPLLQRATKVVALTARYQTHCWLNSERLLLVSSDGKNYNNFERYGDWQGKAILLDRNTGRRQPLPGLTRCLNSEGGVPEEFELSPNGKWLAWTYYDAGDRWPIPAFARLDGSGFYETQEDRLSKTFWLEGHRWAEQETRKNDGPRSLHVTDLENTDHSDVIPLDSARAKGLLRLSASPYAHTFDVSQTAASGRVNGVLEINEYLTTAYEINDEADALHSYPVALPEGIEFLEAFVSQSAKRIVYQVRYRALLPSPKHPLLIDALWSSHLDGSHLHEVGYVRRDKDEDVLDIPESMARRLTEVNWIPGEQAVEFCYHGALYTVPVR